MKVNKFMLRVCHFFGYRKDEAHIDDIKIFIPSTYGHDGNFYEFTTLVVDDIKEQTYKILESNNNLRKTCNRVRQVWVVFPSLLMKKITYIDGILYWPGLDDVAAQRADILSKLLN